MEEIMSLPDTSPSALTPQQLFRFAQIVDTALFKSYLVVRPGLLGPLCRLDNWCEVSEVENELRARGVCIARSLTSILLTKLHIEILRINVSLSRQENAWKSVGIAEGVSAIHPS